MYTHFMRIQCYHSKWCFTCKTYCTVSSCTLCAVKWWVTHRVLSALSQLQTLHISRGCEPENMNDYFGERDREDFLMHVIWHQHYCFCGLTVVSSVAAYFYPCNSYDYYLLSFHAPPIPVFFPLVPSVPLSLSPTLWLSVMIGPDEQRECLPCWQAEFWRLELSTRGMSFIWLHGLTPCFLSGPLTLGRYFLSEPYQFEPQHWNRPTDPRSKDQQRKNATAATKVYRAFCMRGVHFSMLVQTSDNQPSEALWWWEKSEDMNSAFMQQFGYFLMFRYNAAIFSSALSSVLFFFTTTY